MMTGDCIHLFLKFSNLSICEKENIIKYLTQYAYKTSNRLKVNFNGTKQIVSFLSKKLLTFKISYSFRPFEKIINIQMFLLFLTFQKNH